ncbi:hypothetical protein B1218_36105, partial [Pseudomonas ogarae]
MSGGGAGDGLGEQAWAQGGFGGEIQFGGRGDQVGGRAGGRDSGGGGRAAVTVRDQRWSFCQVGLGVGPVARGNQVEMLEGLRGRRDEVEGVFSAPVLGGAVVGDGLR